jgi:uncharacterized FAD-dependent dehydrogenase
MKNYSVNNGELLLNFEKKQYFPNNQPYDNRFHYGEKKIKLFERLSVLDPECNVQFGEGGAGTYSDGKLKVGSMDEYKRWILEKFISHGAPADILFS